MKVTFTAGQRVQYAGTGDFFRLLGTTAPVTVEFYKQGREIAERVDVEAGFAEQFRTIEFDRVDIFSATVQTVQWEVALGSEIRYDRGAATISGSVDLNAATLNQLNRPLADTGTYKSTANITANTAEQLVAPGANLNGLIVQEAKICLFGGASIALGAFITKASAPANVTDGDPVIYAGIFNTTSGGNTISRGDSDGNIWVPAGLGLYFICDTAIAVNAGGQVRMCRYRVL